jgi:hypothetical protein
MPEDASKLTCEEFQNQLAELLASGADIANDPHAKTCEGCCGFIRDLYRIAENSRHFRFGTDKFGSDDWSEST